MNILEKALKNLTEYGWVQNSWVEPRGYCLVGAMFGDKPPELFSESQCEPYQYEIEELVRVIKEYDTDVCSSLDNYHLVDLVELIVYFNDEPNRNLSEIFYVLREAIRRTNKLNQVKGITWTEKQSAESSTKKLSV